MSICSIPMQSIGPLVLKGDVEANVTVPLATYESPLWPSTNRGAKATRLSGGIEVSIVKECMTRSIVFSGQSAAILSAIDKKIKFQLDELREVVSTTSNYCKLQDIHTEIVGHLYYIRLSYMTGDASGHNMVTKASEAIQAYLLKTCKELRYVSVSANICVDKKVSAINSILGRGKHVVVDVNIPRDICLRVLKTSPEKIHELNIKKNLLGSTLAGSLRSANAHLANMLLAIYLATGQDAANIVEGSQGIVYSDVVEGDLYFSVNLPNLIVGCHGNGKNLPHVQENLIQLGCQVDQQHMGAASRRLAAIVGGVCLCGELSLMAAQTNQGELMKAHLAMERPKAQQDENVLCKS